MIFITAKFRVRPEDAARWPEIAAPFTAAEYVLVEAFRNGDAGAAHVGSAHFREAQRSLPPHLAETPRIVNAEIAQDDWSRLGELAVPADG